MNRLKLDMELLNYIFGSDITYYLDLQTGEVLASKDMYPEELENGKRFLWVPYCDSREAASEPIEEFQQYLRDDSHEPDVRLRLEQVV